MLLSLHVTSVLVRFNHFALTTASIGVTRSYSSHPFFALLRLRTVTCDHVLLSLLTHITASPHGNVRFHAHSMSAVAGSLHWCRLGSTPDSLWYSRGGSVEVARRKRKVDRFKISHVRICSSLVSRPHPGFISQPWRKIGRRPGIKTTSQTGNGGLG